MAKIAALTMLRNDEFFLARWVDYYGKALGRENLFVFFDGLDQQVPPFCEGVHVLKCEHRNLERLAGDRHRIDFLSGEAEKLFAVYDMVIGTDVDEFLVPDPELGLSLAEILSTADRSWTSVSGLGIDVGQIIGEEGPVSSDAPLLSQRSRAFLNTRYTKASVLLKPARWGSGFHRVRGHNFHILPGLFLFHFGSCDLGRIKAKMGGDMALREGWSEHLRRRAATIAYCTDIPASDWDSSVRKARRLQSFFRPVYALDKPAMPGRKKVVRIPERFKTIV